VDIDEEELQTHHETLILIKKDLQYAQTNEVVVEDEDDE
jgi:hypothetical protein